jgi:hypothetical protein
LRLATYCVSIMPIPTARIKIELQTLFWVKPAVMTGSDIRYARAQAQLGTGPARMTGRSRPIPDVGGTFDLTPEAIPWIFEFDVNPGDSVSIRVHVTKDLGDVGPPAPDVVTASIPDPWASGVIIFGSAPLAVQVKVTTTYINPTDAAFVARASAASGVSATLTAPQGFFVQLTDILGLYKPVFPIPAPPALGSTHVAGYNSQDDLGRVFTNRLPNGDWKRDTQFIEVQATVIAFGGPTIPAGAKIQWTITDPDDPTNDFSHFHRDWGPYVDPNDYNAAEEPIGAHADDNVGAFAKGNANESKLFGHGVSGSARWHSATGGPAPSASSSSQAKSPLKIVNPTTAKTSVRIHCPNVLGTNMIIKAELIGTPAGIPVHNASTGVITMWSRLDVEVRRMAGAFSVASAIPEMPPYFHQACVQLDFREEKIVTGVTKDRPWLAAHEDDEDTGSETWVNLVFGNRGKGGWFFLGVARLASLLPGGPASCDSSSLFHGTSYDLGKTGTSRDDMNLRNKGVWVELPALLTDPKYVQFSWPDSAGKQLTAGFGVKGLTTHAGKTRLFLSENDLTPIFTGHNADGSTQHATRGYCQYYPQDELPAGAHALVPGGFGVPAVGADVEVVGPGVVVTSGISPTVTIGHRDHWVGQTVIFTDFYKVETLPAPDEPKVAQNPGAGSFPTGRDVYLRLTIVNSHGESCASESSKFAGTAAFDGLKVSSPTLTPWHLALTPANRVTGYNVYEADVLAGGPEPPRSSFKRVNTAVVPIGTPTNVTATATGAVPPGSATASIVPGVPNARFLKKVSSTVPHEFLHALGMPHKCGLWDWRTPREHSCCMNYFDSWLAGPAPDFHLLPNPGGKVTAGSDMCGRHLMEVRRVHFANNPALKPPGW